MSDNLEQRLHDLSIGTGSKTPIAAIDRINEGEQAIANMQREYDKRGDRIEELEAQIKTVLDRETSIVRYYDAKLDAADAKQAKKAGVKS